MIRDFEHWHSTIGEAGALKELQGTRVAIEAADYLYTRILHPITGTAEPLLPALGGAPLALRVYVERDLRSFAEYGIEPLFVFPGLDLAKPEDPFQKRERGAAINTEAWTIYASADPQEAVNKFGESTYVQPEDLFRPFQKVLSENNINFFVAPYSALPQLVEFERSNKVHAIAGSSELLLFPCEKIITSWEFELEQFRFIRRSRCLAEARKLTNNGDFSEDAFVDACLLAGSDFLPTLPSLETPQPKRGNMPKPLAAVDMIMGTGARSGYVVVQNNADDPRLKEMNYLDNYCKARLAVKHQPVVTKDGHVHPSVQGQLPNDAHEFIGQQLPEEIYTYLTRGLLNARILNWRATSEIIEQAPADGGDSVEYQNLVSSRIIPLRTTAINLLSSSLHNWFQHKDLTLKCWFPDSTGKSHTSTISMKGLPESRRTVEMWNVKEAVFSDVVSKHKSCGYLGRAVLALKDEDFVAKSSSKKNASNPLSTEDEIFYNSIWRFLALREYVDLNHNLTAWGRTLAVVISALDGNPDLEEAALLAVELIRLGIIDWDANMFPNYHGAPSRGQPKELSFNLLVSRLAGVGTLHHKPVGYTGPLYQHLLGYNSLINVVRSAVRDLVEVSATQMFLSGCADRNVKSIREIALKLPFLLPINSALSFAVTAYMEEILTHSDTAPDEKTTSQFAAKYFPQSEDCIGDLKTAFKLWDAVFAGVKASGNLVKESDKTFWGEANEYLAARR